MEVKITGAEAVLTERDTLTSGMIGKTVKLLFSEEWDGLGCMAVFRAGEETRCGLLSEDRTEVVIPHEVLQQPERKLFMGVYGADETGAAVLPTVWCELGTVRPGTDPSADASVAATPDAWAQMLGYIKTLEDGLADKMPATESAEASGCYYRTVDGVTEWVNSPRVTGVEYRTSERWRGKAVYEKIIDFGALPNTGYRSTLHKISGIESVVDVRGVAAGSGGFGYSIPLGYTNSSGIGSIDIYVNGSSVIISATTDWSTSSGYVLLKYTKVAG